ncbi:phospholipase D A-like [Meriones unguiculatus]|uniref:phospholipase D A-like n=1 Tax=Meriones unguiculatus TaxID=10047 RepID=UPI00293E7299|nr:phospholipase D A-like [Meriones unguiculatus]
MTHLDINWPVTLFVLVLAFLGIMIVRWLRCKKNVKQAPGVSGRGNPPRTASRCQVTDRAENKDTVLQSCRSESFTLLRRSDSANRERRGSLRRGTCEPPRRQESRVRFECVQEVVCCEAAPPPPPPCNTEPPPCCPPKKQECVQICIPEPPPCLCPRPMITLCPPEPQCQGGGQQQQQQQQSGQQQQQQSGQQQQQQQQQKK